MKEAQQQPPEGRIDPRVLANKLARSQTSEFQTASRGRRRSVRPMKGTEASGKDELKEEVEVGVQEWFEEGGRGPFKPAEPR